MRFSLLLVILLLLSQTGCDNSCGDQKRRIGLNILEEKQLEWSAQGLSNYQLVYQMGCFCPRNTIEVSVVDGSITNVIITDDFSGMPTTIPQQQFENYFTVDKFFSRILELNSSVDVLEVTYHETEGYPNFINVDPHALRCNSDVVDDEFSYSIEVNPPL